MEEDFSIQFSPLYLPMKYLTIIFDFYRYLYSIYNIYNIYSIIYIVYSSFINSSSKNNSVVFYRKKIINKHFFSRKSRKAIRNEMRIFETRDL